ncbi:OLC1v1023659C1 [Oldenlandia corymbosa var. corymbosa]|uniref:OLC1v1023659C1 n=1 Tax=Oldenlandia corymbosa var. corymbosa TaxID=529605 RepID=A0AAV1C0H2_OLDCO|nr:OLC1v1023659C1 [Oldenlandia corymbosa var. corymbosa]
MSLFIPEELWFKILQRLSLRPLFRFKIVCKSWYSHITSPQFTSKSLHTTDDDARKKKIQILLGTPTITKSLFEIEQSAFICDGDDFNFSKIEGPFSSPKTVIGCANGLICLHDDDRYCCRPDPVIILWNPIVKKSLFVNPPSVSSAWSSNFRASFGFGFDQIDNDYKLVRIMSNGGSVALYTLSTGEWQGIRHPAPASFRIKGPCAFFHRAFHWVAFVPGGKHGVLLFDLSNHEFQVMILPEKIQGQHLIDRTMDVHKGSLAIFTFERDRTACKLSIWVMEIYRAEESWTRMHTIDLGDTFLPQLVGIGMNSNFLLLDNDQLVSLDFKGQKRCRLQSMKWSFVKLVTMEESLVLLDWGHQVCDADVNCKRLHYDYFSGGYTGIFKKSISK